MEAYASGGSGQARGMSSPPPDRVPAGNRLHRQGRIWLRRGVPVLWLLIGLAYALDYAATGRGLALMAAVTWVVMGVAITPAWWRTTPSEPRSPRQD